METNTPDTNTVGIDVVSLDDSGSGADGKRANMPAYLDKAPATILTLIKVVQGLGEICIAILCAVVVNTVVSAINQTLQQESIVADIKTMVAQLLNAAKVPASNIAQVLDAIPSQINFTVDGAMAFYVFMAFLPFALLAAIEAVAAVRLRIGKGGTTTMGVLHRIYFAVELIKVLMAAIMALTMTFFTIMSMGFTAGTIVSVIYISLGIFYIIIRIPHVIYHREIARVMGEIGYELGTGMRAKIRASRLRTACIILIVFSVLGAIVSVGSAAESGSNGAVPAALLVSLVAILKYVCVMLSYQNFVNAEGLGQGEEAQPGSHKGLLILILVISLLFVLPTAVLCVTSGRISTAVSESVSDYVAKTKDQVAEMVKKAEEQEKARTQAAAQASENSGKQETAPSAAPAENTGSSEKAGAAQNEEAAGNTAGENSAGEKTAEEKPAGEKPAGENAAAEKAEPAKTAETDSKTV